MANPKQFTPVRKHSAGNQMISRQDKHRTVSQETSRLVVNPKHGISMRCYRFSWKSLLVSLIFGGAIQAQDVAKFPPVENSQIRRVTAEWTGTPIKIDGKLDEEGWKKAQPSTSFVDLVSGEPTYLKTSVSILWDDTNLYLGYEIQEPNVTAKFTKEDDPIYEDNDVEFFIAGQDGYYEFEINAHGTVYDGLFLWQSAYANSPISKWPAFDRTLPGVQSQAFNGVGFTKHPRGLRWAFLDWDFQAVRSAVHIDGTLNDSNDEDRGWSVEVAVPWKELSMLDLTKPRDLPPKPGDVWRIDFSRFNQKKDPSNPKDSGGWALSPHGVWDSHIPEVFPYVQLQKSSPP